VRSAFNSSSRPTRAVPKVIITPSPVNLSICRGTGSTMDARGRTPRRACWGQFPLGEPALRGPREAPQVGEDDGDLAGLVEDLPVWMEVVEPALIVALAPQLLVLVRPGDLDRLAHQVDRFAALHRLQQVLVVQQQLAPALPRRGLRFPEWSCRAVAPPARHVRQQVNASTRVLNRIRSPPSRRRRAPVG